MVTQIVMSPPSQPVSEPPPSPASAAAATSQQSTAATPSQAAAPNDFKQALHSARGKHKAAQPTQATPVTAKKSAPVLVKSKSKTNVVPQTDEDQSEVPEQAADSGDEAAETLAKSATPTPAPAQPGKATAKKILTTAPEEEPEPPSSEATKTPHPSTAVQAITPDTRQPHGNKQQKSHEKSPAKIEPVAEPSAPVALTPNNIPLPTNTTSTPDPTSPPPAQTAPVAALGQNQPGIKPHAAHNAGQSAHPSSQANAIPDAAVPSDQSIADAISESDAASDPASSEAPAAPASTPIQHPIAAITDSLNGLGALAPAHSAESSSASAPVSPTRAFADANQDQIVTTIKGQLLPDGGTMQITLHPDNLGHVHISVQVTAGSVSATFETSNDQATRLLSHNLGQLKQTLESAGVSVEKLQVTQSRDPQPQSQSDSKQSPQQQQTATDQRSSQQEQQRREILQQMWDKITGGQDWVDVKA